MQQPSGQLGRFETATDLDILAVRLPHAAATVLRHRPRPGEPRCEILLADDPALGASRTTADVLIGEVKEGAGEINRGLLKTEVLRSALRRVGCCPEEHIGRAADELLRRGLFASGGDGMTVCRVRLASFAGSFGAPPAPAVLAVTLGHIVAFIAGHLQTYRDVLRSAHVKDPQLAFFNLLEKLRIAPDS